MDFLGTILSPFVWVISWLLQLFHSGFTLIGIPEASGLGWVLAIIFLVIVIRAALIPLFIRQIKAQRGMQIIQPEIMKIQKKYKGRTDTLSRQAMVQEQSALYKKHGTHPLSACLPLLVQMPFFFSLYYVLSQASSAAGQSKSIGALSAEQVQQFDQATILGAPLSGALLPQLQGGNLNMAVVVLSLIMIVVMSLSQFFTQRQLMTKNMTPEALNSPFARSQRMMMYIFPIIFAVAGINFPIGVLIYWTATNLWTMGQQFLVIRNMPVPGSPAAKELAKRKAAKGLPESDTELKKSDESKDSAKSGGQRQQPQRKNRRGQAMSSAQNTEEAYEASEEVVESATDTDYGDNTVASDNTASSDITASSDSELADEGDAAADYLEELLDIADIDGDIDIEVRDGRTFISILSEDEPTPELESLVGGNGEVLTALQDLARLAVVTSTGKRSRLMLDIAGHRVDWMKRIENLANEGIEKMKSSGGSFALKPMNAYERKIVHDFVAEAGLNSGSEGEGRGRHVVISDAE